MVNAYNDINWILASFNFNCQPKLKAIEIDGFYRARYDIARQRGVLE